MLLPHAKTAAERLPKATSGQPPWPKGMMSVHETIAHWAQAQPDAPAVLLGERALTYRQLMRRSARVSAGLKEVRGPVGILVADGLKAILTAVGVMRAGLPIAFLESRQNLENLRSLCTKMQAGAILTDEKNAPLAETILPGKTSSVNALLADEASSGEFVKTDTTAPFAITCKSGSRHSRQSCRLQGAEIRRRREP